ncbi:MAG: CinA family protein [Alphaproteobacteria bacterium]|nr:CinA family protein [Alphaproteobacteria bacterium]
MDAGVGVTIDSTLRTLAAQVLAACRARRIMLVTAESCSGGLLCGALTAVPGSSDVVDRGFVVYSYEAKSELLDVDPAVIRHDGAVSEAVARAMAEGALAHSRAGLAIAITGVAGPGSDSQAKPTGLVWLACAARGRGTIAEVHRFGDAGRDRVRALSVEAALRLVLVALRPATS